MSSSCTGRRSADIRSQLPDSTQVNTYRISKAKACPASHLALTPATSRPGRVPRRHRRGESLLQCSDLFFKYAVTNCFNTRLIKFLHTSHGGSPGHCMASRGSGRGGPRPDVPSRAWWAREAVPRLTHDDGSRVNADV